MKQQFVIIQRYIILQPTGRTWPILNIPAL